MFGTFKKISMTVLAGALLVGLLSMAGGVALAAGPIGAGPADALTPSNEWGALGAGQQIWYAFQYAGDSSPIMVRVSADPSNAVSFSVWTQADVQDWTQGNAPDPVGRGSVSDLYAGDLTWTGSFNEAGVYYVAVESNGPMANYRLQISGNGVSFPTAKPAQSTTESAPAAAQPATVAATTPAKTGYGPGDAMTADGKWATLNVGQKVWYTFENFGTDYQSVVRMSVGPADSASFSVWTADQVRQWQQGEAVEPVGRGSANDLYGGDLVWTGSFNLTGAYYILVEQGGETPGNYALTIN